MLKNIMLCKLICFCLKSKGYLILMVMKNYDPVGSKYLVKILNISDFYTIMTSVPTNLKVIKRRILKIVYLHFYTVDSQQ